MPNEKKGPEAAAIVILDAWRKYRAIKFQPKESDDTRLTVINNSTVVGGDGELVTEIKRKDSFAFFLALNVESDIDSDEDTDHDGSGTFTINRGRRMG
jgi:hypothetical protein